MKYRLGLLIIMNVITGFIPLLGFSLFSGFPSFLHLPQGKDIFPFFVIFHFGVILALLQLFDRFNREMLLYQVSISIIFYLLAALLFGYFTF